MSMWREASTGYKVFGMAIVVACGTCLAHQEDTEEDLMPEKISASAKLVANVGADVVSLIRDMENAIKAGNAEKYLECVDLSDPVFATEQRNWAKDLAKKPPTAIEIALVDEEASDDLAKNGEKATDKKEATPAEVAPVANPNEWTQMIEMKWTQPADKAGGNPTFNRKIKINALFRKTPGDGHSTWKYAGEAWKRVETDHVVVYFDEGLEEVADSAATVFEKIRPRVLEGFALTDAPKDGKQVIKLYVRMAHLQQSIYLSYPHPLGGWNEPGESIKILANKRTGEATLRGLLSHEYGHVCTFALGDKANDIPWWALEGVAELSTTPFDSKAIMRAKQAVQRWAKNDNLKAWNDLADFNIVPADMHGHVYTQGMHMIWYISDRFGRESRIKWLTSMANGKTIDDATREVLEMPFDQLDREWRASVMQAAESDEKPDRDE